MAQGLQALRFSTRSFPQLQPEVHSLLAATTSGPSTAPAPSDPDAAAREFLRVLFVEPSMPSFAATAVEPSMTPPELELLEVQEEALSGATVVAYQQTWRGVPVHGARLGVELGAQNALHAVTGQVVRQIDADPVATLSPAEAQRIVKRLSGLSEQAQLQPREAPLLRFRYHEASEAWRLAYVFRHVRAEPQARDELYTIFLDGHNGEELARIPEAATVAVEGSGRDARGNRHRFKASKLAEKRFVLEDPDRKIRTLSLGFSDIFCGPTSRPGRPIESTSEQFSHEAGVVAHAHASRVYDYFRQHFQRRGIDGKGGWIVSSVDCTRYRLAQSPLGPVCLAHDPAQRTWRDAAWLQGQMVYGQTVWPTDGRLHTYAEALDVVAHELTHGVTSSTSDLEYRTESGALNESYSDIIGIAVANADRNDIVTWDWKLGEELSPGGIAIRDIANPTARGQPDHLNDYQHLPAGEPPSRKNDQGYVHHNSGIHNRAAFNVYASGSFTPIEVTQLFYLTLTTPGRLTPTADFLDSRDGMLASCESLFRNAPDLNERLAAITTAFADAGIA